MLAQILCHALCKCRDEDALTLGNSFVDFFNEVVDLIVARANFDFWIEQAGRTNDLLGWLWAARNFILARSGGNVNNLIDVAVKLRESKRAIIERGW